MIANDAQKPEVIVGLVIEKPTVWSLSVSTAIVYNIIFSYKYLPR